MVDIETAQQKKLGSPESHDTHDSKNRLVQVDSIFEGMNENEADELKDRIYECYATAMQRRERQPLQSERFKHHFFEEGNFQEPKVFGGPKDGYLLGGEVNGVFIPTHFAPSGLKGGYRLISDLIHDDIPTALFITDDLVETISKMKGWKVLPFHFSTNFRGSNVKKTLVVNKWDAVPKLISYQAKEVVTDILLDVSHRTEDLLSRAHDLGKKALRLIRKDEANADDIHDELQEAVAGEQSLSDSTFARIKEFDLSPYSDE